MHSGKLTRPVFLDLRRIRQPVTAVVSLGHRVSGVVLVVSVPVLAWLLQRSLAGPDAFAELAASIGAPAAKVGILILALALAHHAFAGVRHLLFDVHIATGPAQRAEQSRPARPRAAAWLVLAADAIVVLATLAALAS